MADEFCLKMSDFHITFRDLLHAVNLRHGTDGFTSPPKEGVLRIFSPWKIQGLRSGLNPRSWVPKASTLPLDHGSRFRHINSVYILPLSLNSKLTLPLHLLLDLPGGFLPSDFFPLQFFISVPFFSIRATYSSAPILAHYAFTISHRVIVVSIVFHLVPLITSVILRCCVPSSYPYHALTMYSLLSCCGFFLLFTVTLN